MIKKIIFINVLLCTTIFPQKKKKVPLVLPFYWPTLITQKLITYFIIIKIIDTKSINQLPEVACPSFLNK